MATILSADFGDERSSTNVLSSLKSKYNRDGKLDVLVGSGLIPFVITGGDSVELTDQDVKDAKDKAVSACGNALDTVCVEKKSQEFQLAALEEKKRNQDSNSANILKGRRLRVTYKDESGKVRTMEVPEGQHFTLDKPESPDAFTVSSSKPMFPSLTLGNTVTNVLTIVAIIVGTALYAFSVFLTWRSFKTEGYSTYMTAIPTAIAAIFPFSGFLIVLFFFAGATIVRNQIMPANV